MKNELIYISRLLLSNLRYNKLALLFNLLFPTVYFIFMYQSSEERPEKILENMNFFWTYIIFVSILNFIILPIIGYRESGIYRQLWVIVANKNSIMCSLFLVYMFVIALELIIFNMAVMSMTKSWEPKLIASSLLTLLLFGPPVYMELTILLSLKIKVESITVLSTVLIFVLFTMSSLNSEKFYLETIYVLNPIKFLLVASTWLLNIIDGKNIDFLIMLQLIIVAVIMTVIGVFSLKKFNVKPLIRQM